jgi:hypothetical protein
VVLQHDFPWWSPSSQADHRGDQPGGEANLDLEFEFGYGDATGDCCRVFVAVGPN